MKNNRRTLKFQKKGKKNVYLDQSSQNTPEKIKVTIKKYHIVEAIS
jgi:hypothetical protein